MGKAARFAVIGLFVFPAVLRSQGSSARDLEKAEAQYVALQADLFDPQTLTADGQAAETIARFLQAIRAQYPATAALRISPEMTARTSILLGLQNSFRPQVQSLCRGQKGYARAQRETLGIAPLDATTRQFGGSYEVSCQEGRVIPAASYVVINFPRLLHVPSLTRFYKASAAVSYAENNLLILGGVLPVSVQKEGSHWRVTFGHGWGDCPAGCTGREYFFFRVAPDFSIEYLGTEKSGEETGAQR